MNPILPNYEYVPDGEPHVFNDRIYLFGSHDMFGSKWTFCVNDYVVYSAPLSNPSAFVCNGVSYKKTQDPFNKEGKNQMWAPDVVKGKDGNYYLYYCLANFDGLAVAKASKPEGPYEYYGYIHDKNNNLLGRRKNDSTPFDPAVLLDDDGTIYLYAGQGPLNLKDLNNPRVSRKYAYVLTLEDDMVTMKTEPKQLIPNVADSKGTGFEGHEFFEASSIRKFNGKYYFIYSSVLSHELVYARSDYPDREFRYCGTLVSNGDVVTDRMISYAAGGSKDLKNYIGNNHGSIAYINGEYYIFYHRHTNRRMFSRQACADKIIMDENGYFHQALMTSQGLDGILGKGTYHASSACELYSKEGACYSAHPMVQNKKHPAFTQEEKDGSEKETQYINNMKDGATAVYKYFDLKGVNAVSAKVRGKGTGKLVIKDENNAILAEIPVSPSKEYRTYEASFKESKGKELYFVFEGKKAIDFVEFTLK